MNSARHATTARVAAATFAALLFVSVLKAIGSVLVVAQIAAAASRFGASTRIESAVVGSIVTTFVLAAVGAAILWGTGRRLRWARWVAVAFATLLSLGNAGDCWTLLGRMDRTPFALGSPVWFNGVTGLLAAGVGLIAVILLLQPATAQAFGPAAGGGSAALRQSR